VQDALGRDPVLRDRLALALASADGFDARALEAAIDATALAIELLAELHGLLATAGHEDARSALVAEVRGAHRRKRNLMRMLDAQQWPGACP
jgi:uncharacterized Zn finger protein